MVHVTSMLVSFVYMIYSGNSAKNFPSNSLLIEIRRASRSATSVLFNMEATDILLTLADSLDSVLSV